MGNIPIIGIFYAVAADLVWGLAFVIPKLLSTYSAVEIAFGRYLTYGIISLIIFGFSKKTAIDLNLWRRALLFAFCGNIGYYFFLVLAIQLTGGTIATLVIGVLPISISLYGNWLNREFNFIKVWPSVCLIFIGIVAINYSHIINNNEQEWNYNGFACSLIALALWTWYGVANAQFLKDNPRISPANWASITGIATLCLLPVFTSVSILFIPEAINVGSIFYSSSSWQFLIGSIILGVVVSWIGTMFWNRASHLLPVSLAGQLIVGETLCGLGYVFFIDVRLPYFFEWIGIIIILSGVLFGIRTINRLKGVDTEIHVQS